MDLLVLDLFSVTLLSPSWVFLDQLYKQTPLPEGLKLHIDNVRMSSREEFVELAQIDKT